ncbi:MAG: polysaccharide biosynthesis C-terminal domain-containing protein [Bacteroidetes bacterium]|nr:polysaccharide biosynthesis C-terminal domain-containing protein [Bacteroidota bacterium]
MNRAFLLNILLLLFINILIKPLFIFGIDLQVQNRVGAEYGLYFALLNLAYVFQILNDFGIQTYNNRNISQFPHLLPKYFPNLLALKLILSTGYMVASMVLAFVLFGYGWAELPLFSVLLFNQVLVQLVLFMRSNISGLGYYQLDSFLSALDKLLMLFTCGALVWIPGLCAHVTVLQFALAQTFALALTLILVYLLLRSKVQLSLKPDWLGNWRSGWPTILLLMRKSIPYALVILLMFAYSRLDAVLLERLLPDGKVHADVYAGAYRLLDASNMFGYLFATLLLPMYARLLRHGNADELRSLVSVSFKLIWAGSITLSAAIFFARADLVKLMMPERASAYRWDTLGILIWVFVPVCMLYIFSTILTADEKLGRMNRYFVIGIGIDLLLNILLAPQYKAYGSAVATLCTHIFVASAVTILASRTFQLRPSRRGLIQVLGFACFVLACDWFLFEKTALLWYLQFVLALLGGLIGLFLFGLFDVRAIRRGVLEFRS